MLSGNSSEIYPAAMHMGTRLRALDRRVLGPPKRVSKNVRPIVSADDFVAQFEAARQLEISSARVLWRVLCGQLDGVQNERGEEGVSSASLAKELSWQASAGRLARARRAIWNVVQWISP